MIILDASVLIAHLGAADGLHERAVQLLTDAAGESFGASPLTLAEVFVGPARAGRLEIAEGAVRDLAIDLVPLDSGAPARLAVLRSETGLRLPDCCVLLAAEAASAEIATFDERLASSAVRRGLRVR